jgi:DNA-binding transcriptional MerR regulator
VDEPSNAELGRSLTKIEKLLRDLPTRGEYVADQRSAERQFDDVKASISELRKDHDNDIKEVRAEIGEVTRTSGTNFRQNLYQGILPALIFAVGMLVTILLAFRGGK